MLSDLPPAVLLPAVIITAVVVLLFRLGAILAEDVRNAPPPSVPRTPPRETAPGFWQVLFPSRIEQLSQATTLTRAETDLLQSQREELEARSALLRAEAELATLNAPPEPAQPTAREPAAAPPRSARTLEDIHQVVALTTLSPQERDDLFALLSAHIEEIS